MIHLNCLLLTFLFLIGCTTTATYSRVGYKLDSEENLPKKCDIPIKYQYQSSSKKLLGSIESHEPLFGTHCHEEMVLTRFRKEGCYIGANLVNVVTEQQPDYFWRACYKAKAELLKVNESLSTDDKYEATKLHSRSMISHQKAKAANAAAVSAGINGGLSGASSQP